MKISDQLMSKVPKFCQSFSLGLLEETGATTPIFVLLISAQGRVMHALPLTPYPDTLTT